MENLIRNLTKGVGVEMKKNKIPGASKRLKKCLHCNEFFVAIKPRIYCEVCWAKFNEED